MEIKIKSLGCITTGGVDPIDAFGQFLAERVSLLSSFDYKVTGDSVMCLFKLTIEESQYSTNFGVETQEQFDYIVINTSTPHEQLVYYFPKTTDGFKYISFTSPSTVNGTTGNIWAIAGPRGTKGKDTAPDGVIPVSLENLKNFKSFLEAQDIELNK